LLVLAGLAGVVAILITVTWFCTGAPIEKTRISPWEQGRFTEADPYVRILRRTEADSYADFPTASRNYGYNKPAIKVASAEAEVGDDDEYRIDDDLLHRLRAVVDSVLQRERHRSTSTLHAIDPVPRA